MTDLKNSLSRQRSMMNSEINKLSEEEPGTIKEISRKEISSRSELKNKLKVFDFQSDYAYKKKCTSYHFGLLPISQLLFYCPYCNPKKDIKMCKYCYLKCHALCRKMKSKDNLDSNENSKKDIQNKYDTFACLCGLALKHMPDRKEERILVACNMLELDKTLKVSSIFCKTHQIQVCCVCSVTCHKKCELLYKDCDESSGSCRCRSDFHSNYNELALSFPLNEYKQKTGIAVWSIQILNILFKTKNVFQKMADLFTYTMKHPLEHIDANFYPLLELFSNTLNRKFKTFYYNDEITKMFKYENLIDFLFKLPSTKPKYYLVKFRILFLIVFIHLKVDYQMIKVLTSIDFLIDPIIQRLKYKLMYKMTNVLTSKIQEKYFADNTIMKIAIDEACTLTENGMTKLSIEENQDEFEIGLKFICFLLKHLIFNNEELTKMTKSLYSFFDKFYRYLTNKHGANIYSLLGIFNTVAEILLEIGVSYNDNVALKFFDKDESVSFIHTDTEIGNLLFKMVLKSCDILKIHYDLIKKPGFDLRSADEKQRELQKLEHKRRMQERIESRTTGVKLKLPENGGLLVEKIVMIMGKVLNLFCLADNFYCKQLNSITKDELIDFLNFKKKINNETFGNFYSNSLNKKDKSNALYTLKLNIENLLYNLFDGNYQENNNSTICLNIDSYLNEFIFATFDKFNVLTQSMVLQKAISADNDQNNLNENKIEIFTNKLINKIKTYLTFVSVNNFKLGNELTNNFIDTLCLYSLDESLSKCLEFFTDRDFPLLLTLDLYKKILDIFRLYLLSSTGTQYFLTGKNLSRLRKMFRRFQCMKKMKNINPKFGKELNSNLKFTEETLTFLNQFGTALKLYKLNIKGHKILSFLKDNILEHIETLVTSKEDNLELIKKMHFVLSIKFFDVFNDHYELEDSEDIKRKILFIFLVSKFDLVKQNYLVEQLNIRHKRLNNTEYQYHKQLEDKNAFNNVNFANNISNNNMDISNNDNSNCLLNKNENNLKINLDFEDNNKVGNNKNGQLIEKSDDESQSSRKSSRSKIKLTDKEENKNANRNKIYKINVNRNKSTKFQLESDDLASNLNKDKKTGPYGTINNGTGTIVSTNNDGITGSKNTNLHNENKKENDKRSISKRELKPASNKKFSPSRTTIGMTSKFNGFIDSRNKDNNKISNKISSKINNRISSKVNNRVTIRDSKSQKSINPRKSNLKNYTKMKSNTVSIIKEDKNKENEKESVESDDKKKNNVSINTNQNQKKEIIDEPVNQAINNKKIDDNLLNNDKKSRSESSDSSESSSISNLELESYSKESELELKYNIKLYFLIFKIVSKQTYYVYIGSQSEELVDFLMDLISTDKLTKLFSNDKKYLYLKEKSVLLKYLRTIRFIEHLDRINLFAKIRLLTNEEYKKMIYNKLVEDKSLEFIKPRNEYQLNDKYREEYNIKFEKIMQIESLVDLYINELQDFPIQINNANSKDIYNFLSELVFGIKMIADYFFLNNDLVNILVLKLYCLAIEFVRKSDGIRNMLKDVIEKGQIELLRNYASIESDKVKFLKSTSFNVYSKDVIYKLINEEIFLIFKETKIGKEFSLSNYLDVFDNLQEANFTPFSLIETYDYEYFYQEEADKEIEELNKDTFERKLLKLKNNYINEFINVTNTNFYIVLTTLGNENIRVDYRKIIINYFTSFFNSEDNYITYKLESILCIINKLLFYDGEEMQPRFKKLRYDKFFFPNFNFQLHELIIQSIVSAQNYDIFNISVKNINLSKLHIQFLQLLGEGFKEDFHDNIFRLQNEIINSGKYKEEDELDHFEVASQTNSVNNNTVLTTDQKQEDGEAESELSEITHFSKAPENNSPGCVEVRRIYSTSRQKFNLFYKRTSNYSQYNKTRTKTLGGNKKKFISYKYEHCKVYQVNETIFNSLIMSLKRAFGIMNIESTIEGELPYDKLIVLISNIIDFLIEYNDTTPDKEHLLLNGINNLFFGINYKRRGSTYYNKMECKGLLKDSLFTKLEDYEYLDKFNVEELGQFSLRKKVLSFIKTKFIDLLISYLYLGKHQKMLNKLQIRNISPIKFFSEILYNFKNMIFQIKLINEDLYESLIKKQSDQNFLNNLLRIYVYEDIFNNLIEFPLCMKMYILIKIYEEIYGDNVLRDHFQKLYAANLKQTKRLDEEENIGIDSYFAKRIHMFLQEIVLTVEIKNSNQNENEEEENENTKKHKQTLREISVEEVNGITNKIYEFIFKGKGITEQDERESTEDENLKQSKTENSTKITFFIRPYITFLLSNNSMEQFEDEVDRVNATSKYIGFVKFSDYSLFEMICNKHKLGNNKILLNLSNINYLYIEIINYVIILIQNILVMRHFYKSPDMAPANYDVIDTSLSYKRFDDNFYISLFQMIFIVLSLANWLWFKYINAFMKNMMNDYNINFVVKNNEHDESMPVSIINYFKDQNASVYKIIWEKIKNKSIIWTLYTAIFKTLILNRDICYLSITFIFLCFYLKYTANLCLCLPVILVINLSETLMNIFKAISLKFSSMSVVIIFTLIITYLYSWFTYFYLSFLFDSDEIKEKSSGQKINESFCKSSIQCFLFITQVGLTAGGGIGDKLAKMSYKKNVGFFLLRFGYDMIFFIFIILILFNVFMGIIVDTFAELRDDNWMKENDRKNICFICQLSRDDCLTKNIDYETHIKKTHNVWNYLYFLIYLYINDENNFNSIEDSVFIKIAQKDYSWIPINEQAQ